MPDFALERRAGGVVCGLDEAGRGPLAGPVFAAAVILDHRRTPRRLRTTIDDSKALSRACREQVFAGLTGVAVIGVGYASVEEIDRINILEASLLAMRRAIDALGIVPDRALVDGNRPPALPCPAECIVGGDGRSLSIAAASIVAKVTRDRLMIELAETFPGYGWQTNVGYGTAEHRLALRRLGPTCHHRQSFSPVRAARVCPSEGLRG